MQTNETIQITKDEVLSTVQQMKDEDRFLILIHGHREKDGTPVITYDFSFGSLVKSFEVRGEESLPTVSGIYDQAAAWPEREINELIGVTFEGLDCSKRLFMPDNMLSGQDQILVTPIEDLKKANGNL